MVSRAGLTGRNNHAGIGNAAKRVCIVDNRRGMERF